MEQFQISLEILTTDSVNIKKQNYYYREGKEPIEIDIPWRTALQNSERGREELKDVLGEDSHEYKAVMQMWGDDPTVVEAVPEIPFIDEPEEPTDMTEIESLPQTLGETEAEF